MPPRRKLPITEAPSTLDALRDRFKDFPNLDVLERRLLDPHDPGSLPIYLRDEPDRACGDIGHAYAAGPRVTKCRTCGVPFRTWYVRWINAGEAERWSTIRGRGYVKVEVRELKNREDLVGAAELKETDPVTRGDRKSEVLAKIPFAFYIEIRRQKQALAAGRRGKTALKNSITEAAGREMGDEAGQTIHDRLQVESFTRHKTTLSEEMGLE